MELKDQNKFPHRRKNILTGEWILVSPHRTQRPWQGDLAKSDEVVRSDYDPDCYLCPGNRRANGETNPDYKSTFVFTNDYSSLLPEIPGSRLNSKNLLVSKSERGICRVVNFSPKHNLTLAEMDPREVEEVITTWQDETASLSTRSYINYIQIFENKGAMMGNSNPHPHCQIWAQESIPDEPQKELKHFGRYFAANKKSLLSDYLKLELKLKERVVFENGSFAVLVPFWAVWPFETLIVSKRKLAWLTELRETEKREYAEALNVITSKYDNMFRVSFPYSSGIHQAPTDGKKYKEWHIHMHFYPPLLRSAVIKKFMVGYEMMAEPQRDITPEYSAQVLRNLSAVHYKKDQK
jgi:UDPglucose--hexose-1-phosphate uridylyltransferase